MSVRRMLSERQIERYEELKLTEVTETTLVPDRQQACATPIATSTVMNNASLSAHEGLDYIPTEARYNRHGMAMTLWFME
jgi:hypothetical protein